MPHLYTLRNQRYFRIKELQDMIAAQSKPAELSTSPLIEGTKTHVVSPNHLSWMILNIGGEIPFDTNTNPLHQKLMEIYFLDQKIDEAEHDLLEQFMRKKYTRLRKRIASLEVKHKTLQNQINVLNKKVLK